MLRSYQCLELEGLWVTALCYQCPHCSDRELQQLQRMLVCYHLKDAVKEKQRKELQWQYLVFPQALKSTLGFPLIRFEDAVINLDPFTRVHPYETQEFIINDILKHFQEVSVMEKMLWQRLNLSWLRSSPLRMWELLPHHEVLVLCYFFGVWRSSILEEF